MCTYSSTVYKYQLHAAVCVVDLYRVAVHPASFVNPPFSAMTISSMAMRSPLQERATQVFIGALLFNLFKKIQPMRKKMVCNTKWVYQLCEAMKEEEEKVWHFWWCCWLAFLPVIPLIKCLCYTCKTNMCWFNRLLCNTSTPLLEGWCTYIDVTPSWLKHFIYFS